MPSQHVAAPPRQFRNKISEFGVEGSENEDGHGVKPQAPLVLAAAALASSTQQLASNSTTTTSTTSRVAKSSQRILSSSSSSSSTAEMKASTIKSDLTKLKSSISEMKSMSSTAFGQLRSSVEDLCGAGCEDEGGGQPIITFPDPESPQPQSALALQGPQLHMQQPQLHLQQPQLPNSSLKFEQKRMTSASNTKVVVDGFSAERNVANSAELKTIQAADFQTGQGAMLEAAQQLNIIQEKKSYKSGEIAQNVTEATNVRLQTESVKLLTSQTNTTTAQQRTITTMSNQDEKRQNITFSKMERSHINSSSQKINTHLNGQTMKMIEDDAAAKITFDELERLSNESSQPEVEEAKRKYSEYIVDSVKLIKSLKSDGRRKVPQILNRMNEVIKKAWEVPTHGHEIGSALCNALRTSGGLDFLLTNNTDGEQQFAGAKLLEQCLTSENRDYVVENGLEMVVTSACYCCNKENHINSVEHSRVGTGILEHLFKHSEGTCSDVIRLGGLDSVLFECRKNDVETLRHCASALANLSLYGGAESHEQMIKRKVPMWLFPLAFHHDDNIKYYACLAIAALVANKEIEAAVLKSGTLDLVEPFITTHSPFEFANSNQAHAHGQSKHWLQKLVPVLSSIREEARNLAAFHFCMEAGIKKRQGNTEIFREIGAVEPLKKVASCPNAIASKFAAQALGLIGEKIPHKLSQQVPLWSTEDVSEWVKQIGFGEYAANFKNSRVDGDLILQLTENNLIHDIGITNGILQKRFTRELQNLKKMADYSSRDPTNLNGFLTSVDPEYTIYTYAMLNAGVNRDTLRYLKEDHAIKECGVVNTIHIYRILDTIRAHENSLGTSFEENLDKSLDVFISYRRSNGSQLASLLKVHLQLKGFTVFIDVERLEAGKFDNNLLQSIKSAKHFILVLTPQALDRCIDDEECKDWVHREIVAALQASCNIIPIFDNFSWPEVEKLPRDMRQVCGFNGVTWIHDYQDACVEKLERFMRGDLARGAMGMRSGDVTPGTPSLHHPCNISRNISTDGSDGSRD